jgi:hypothetical protein
MQIMPMIIIKSGQYFSRSKDSMIRMHDFIGDEFHSY